MLPDFTPDSTLGFGFAISRIAYFGGTYIGRPELTDLALPFVAIFGGIWGIFVFFSIVRNAKNL